MIYSFFSKNAFFSFPAAKWNHFFTKKCNFQTKEIVLQDSPIIIKKHQEKKNFCTTWQKLWKKVKSTTNWQSERNENNPSFDRLINFLPQPLINDIKWLKKSPKKVHHFVLHNEYMHTELYNEIVEILFFLLSVSKFWL